MAESVSLKCSCSSSSLTSENNKKEEERIDKEEDKMEEVLEKIENSRPRQITLEDEKKSGGNCANLYAKVLEKVTNGNQIIMDCLDESITETSDDPNDRNYGIKVDFR